MKGELSFKGSWRCWVNNITTGWWGTRRFPAVVKNGSCLSRIFCIAFPNQGHRQERWWNGDSCGSAGGLLFSRQNPAEVRPVFHMQPWPGSIWEDPRLLEKLPGTGSYRLLSLRSMSTPTLFAFHLAATSLWQGDLGRGLVNPQTIRQGCWVCTLCKIYAFRFLRHRKRAMTLEVTEPLRKQVENVTQSGLDQGFKRPTASWQLRISCIEGRRWLNS